jgi:hypothetical protein
VLIDLNLIDKKKFINYLNNRESEYDHTAGTGIDAVDSSYDGNDIMVIIHKLFGNSKYIYMKVCDRGLFGIAAYLYKHGYRMRVNKN